MRRRRLAALASPRGDGKAPTVHAVDLVTPAGHRRISPRAASAYLVAGLSSCARRASTPARDAVVPAHDQPRGRAAGATAGLIRFAAAQMAVSPESQGRSLPRLPPGAQYTGMFDEMSRAVDRLALNDASVTVRSGSSARLQVGDDSADFVVVEVLEHRRVATVAAPKSCSRARPCLTRRRPAPGSCCVDRSRLTQQNAIRARSTPDTLEASDDWPVQRSFLGKWRPSWSLLWPSRSSAKCPSLPSPPRQSPPIESSAGRSATDLCLHCRWATCRGAPSRSPRPASGCRRGLVHPTAD